MDAKFDPMDHDTPRQDLAVLTRLVHHVSEGNRLCSPIRVLEVGSWAGLSTLALAQPGVQVHCVDHWQGNPGDRLGEVAKRYPPELAFQTFCRNMGWRLFKTVFPHRGSSLLYASIWPMPMDLIFIDARHEYEHVANDIHAWLPHVRAGGILCGHDYGVFPGVTRAADEIGRDGVEGNVWWKLL
jgi:hypothetical protein